jgi:hypothetical protein
MIRTRPFDAVRGEQAISQLAFFLLFPGFFFYHTVLGVGAVGAFLGGYFAPVSLLVVVPLLTVYVAKLRRNPNRLSRVDMSFLLFLCYFLAVVALNAARGKSLVIVVNHMLAILFLINIFVMFKTINFDSPAFRRLTLASLLGMSTIVLSYSVDGVFYLGALGMAKDAASLATYQGFSRSYLVTFAVLIAYTRPAWLRVLLYGLALPTLYVNTARSEFAALLFLIPIIEFYHTRNKILMLFLFGVLLVLLKSNLEQIVSMLPNNRILELLDLTQSTSANKRHHLSVHAVQTILAHPILGDYASYASGYYAHNILSAWVDLGLLGIAAIFAILVLPAVPMVADEYFARKYNGEFLLGLGFGCITLLLLLTSHYFTDMLIGATLGSYSKYWYGRRYDKHRAFDFGASAPRYPDIRQAVPQPGEARI